MQDFDALVREAQQGNRGAFTQIYEALVDRVYRYILVRVGSEREAEDLTQEAFVKVLRALPSYQFRGRPFTAWIFRIAHNVIVDRHRHRHGQDPLPLEDVEPISSDEDVPQQVLRSLELEQVYRALAELTELQRRVIQCRFVAELSLVETAKAMDRDVNAVKALQHAALKALRRAVQRQSLGREKVDR